MEGSAIKLFWVTVMLILYSSTAAKSKNKPNKNGSPKYCTGPDNQKYKVGDGYNDRCAVFTCTKAGKNLDMKESLNKTHCCHHQNNTYILNDMFNSTIINGTCTTRQLKCVPGNVDLTVPAKIVKIYYHGSCCTYRHSARDVGDYFDEFFNGTILNRHQNFSMFLLPGQNISIPEKCANLTCILNKPLGVAALALEKVHDSCNCCWYKSNMYQDGDQNIPSEAGEKMTCCGGQLVPMAEQQPTQEENGVGLLDHLTGEEHLADQIAALTAVCTCPTCQQEVPKYWPNIATQLYTFFLTQEKPCQEMGMEVCNSKTHSWSCSECKDAISSLASMMAKSSYVAEAVGYLQGPAYCGNAELVRPRHCHLRMALGVPRAIPYLSKAIMDHKISVCTEVIEACPRSSFSNVDNEWSRDD